MQPAENNDVRHRTHSETEGAKPVSTAAEKRALARQLSRKLHTPVTIIDDIGAITHPNAAIQVRRRGAKGWYDTHTGEVVIVLPNNRSTADVAATIAHETIAHRGLRELVGEASYDTFLDQVYSHLSPEIKAEIDRRTTHAFTGDLGESGRKRGYEQHRREQVDEYMARLAEKPFDEFSEGERTVWQRIKDAVRRIIDRFLGTLKLPQGFEIGDNELRYMLWRSKNRMEQGKMDYVQQAADIAKRNELGLDDAVYSGQTERAVRSTLPPEVTRGIKPRHVAEMERIAEQAKATGTYMKAPDGKTDTKLNERQWLQVRTQGFKRWAGIWDLASKVVNISDVSELSFANNTAFMEYAKEHFQKGGKWNSYVNKDTGNEIHLSSTGINKSISNKAVDKSAVSRADHLRALGKLDEILENSILGETHKDKNGQPNVPEIQLYYGAVTIDGNIYRIKTTVKKVRLNSGELSNRQYSFEVQEMELIEERPARQEIGDTKGVNSPTNSNNSISGANLLKNVEKSNGSGIKILDDHTQVLDPETKEPKPVKHGTPNNFTAFDEQMVGSHNDAGWLGTGFYFYGNNPDYAAQYSVKVDENGNFVHGNVMDVFLNIRNPYYATYEEFSDLAEKDSSAESMAFTEDRKQDGYDGVFYNGDLNEEWVAYSPNQIKSATDNNGEFSEHDDIRFRDGEDDADDAVYSDPNADIWKDSTLNLQEKITATAMRLAEENKDSAQRRHDATQALGRNLASLRKAMSLQREFDRTTVKRVADLARILIRGGHIDTNSRNDIARLLSAVKNANGKDDISGDVAAKKKRTTCVILFS